MADIHVKEKEIELTQYADDTASFVKDALSLRRLLDLLTRAHFKDWCGLKISSSKSEAIWLGKWPQKPITA